MLALCLAEARPCVLVICLLRLLAGAALSNSVHVWHTLATAFVWILAIFFAYLFNGVTDIAADKINNSNRPIARGDLPPEYAMRVALGAAALALIGAAALGGPMLWTVPLLVFFGYAYSGSPWHLKRRSTGTAVTVLCAGLLTYYTGFAGISMRPPGNTLFIFAVAMSLWMALVGALTKDFSDVAGDAAAGRRTCVVVWGEHRARVAASLAALGLAATFLTAVMRLTPELVVPALILLVGAGTVTFYSLSAPGRGDSRRARRPYRAFMTTQYAVHLSVML